MTFPNFKSILRKRSFWVFAILTAFVGYKVFQYHVPALYSWDLFGSYIYLPMIFDQHTFLYTDLSYFEKLNEAYHLSPTLYQFVVNDNGQIMTKYTLGWSLLMAPFYGIAEVWAHCFGFKTDGFSFPYKLMLVLGNLFYMVLALIQVKALFRRFFTEKWSLTLIFLLFLGTNLLFTQYASLGSTHLIAFLLVTIFINRSFIFYEQICLKNGIYLGLVLGLIFLVRPPDAVIGLLPILWKNTQFPTFKSKMSYFLKQRMIVLLGTVFSFMILISFQFIYWKIVAGKFFINSYANNPGEGFDWFHPHVFEILFSFRKGWFLYTPLAVLGLIGFFFWLKRDKNAFSFILSFLVFFYVASTWTTWWYADSFSQRAFIDFILSYLLAWGF